MRQYRPLGCVSDRRQLLVFASVLVTTVALTGGETEMVQCPVEFRINRSYRFLHEVNPRMSSEGRDVIHVVRQPYSGVQVEAVEEQTKELAYCTEISRPDGVAFKIMHLEYGLGNAGWDKVSELEGARYRVRSGQYRYRITFALSPSAELLYQWRSEVFMLENDSYFYMEEDPTVEPG